MRVLGRAAGDPVLATPELPCIVLTVYDLVSSSDLNKRIIFFKRARDDSGPEKKYANISYFINKKEACMTTYVGRRARSQ